MCIFLSFFFSSFLFLGLLKDSMFCSFNIRIAEILWAIFKPISYIDFRISLKPKWSVNKFGINEKSATSFNRGIFFFLNKWWLNFKSFSNPIAKSLVTLKKLFLQKIEFFNLASKLLNYRICSCQVYQTNFSGNFSKMFIGFASKWHQTGFIQ